MVLNSGDTQIQISAEYSMHAAVYNILLVQKPHSTPTPTACPSVKNFSPLVMRGYLVITQCLGPEIIYS